MISSKCLPPAASYRRRWWCARTLAVCSRTRWTPRAARRTRGSSRCCSQPTACSDGSASEMSCALLSKTSRRSARNFPRRAAARTSSRTGSCSTEWQCSRGWRTPSSRARPSRWARRPMETSHTRGIPRRWAWSISSKMVCCASRRPRRATASPSSRPMERCRQSSASPTSCVISPGDPIAWAPTRIARWSSSASCRNPALPPRPCRWFRCRPTWPLSTHSPPWRRRASQALPSWTA
mmetsp:Transcript_8900/g.36303  ORF Transcript_8900/g.36303 Transcript_8900/m.36303 type:complete len:237 (-) Transcript_8900:553-1263(-)